MSHRSPVSATASAPGKAILFGEHAVVYGKTAVAASLSDLRIQAEISTTQQHNKLEVTFNDFVNSSGAPTVAVIEISEIQNLVEKHEDPFGQTPDTAVTTKLAERFAAESVEVKSGLMSIVYLVGKILSPYVRRVPSAAMNLQGLRVHIESKGLPIGAGLGSSAAFSVAVAAACLRLQALLYPALHALSAEIGAAVDEAVGPPASALAAINAWAYASEILLHGTPSGLDNTTSCYGGLVRFVKGEPFHTIQGVPPLHILLVNTKVPRSTKQLVAGVRALHDALPTTVPLILEAMNRIALQFLGTIEALQGKEVLEDSAEYATLVMQTGELMTMNHHLLNAVGVGHAALSAVVDASAGAHYTSACPSTVGRAGRGFACKLTGAGGGGCAIVLSPEPFLGAAATPSDAHDSEVQSALAELVNRIRLLGCDVHHSAVAGKGVMWW